MNHANEPIGDKRLWYKKLYESVSLGEGGMEPEGGVPATLLEERRLLDEVLEGKREPGTESERRYKDFMGNTGPRSGWPKRWVVCKRCGVEWDCTGYPAGRMSKSGWLWPNICVSCDDLMQAKPVKKSPHPSPSRSSVIGKPEQIARVLELLGLDEDWQGNVGKVIDPLAWEDVFLAAKKTLQNRERDWESKRSFGYFRALCEKLSRGESVALRPRELNGYKERKAAEARESEQNRGVSAPQYEIDQPYHDPRIEDGRSDQQREWDYEDNNPY